MRRGREGADEGANAEREQERHAHRLPDEASAGAIVPVVRRQEGAQEALIAAEQAEMERGQLVGRVASAGIAEINQGGSPPAAVVHLAQQVVGIEISMRQARLGPSINQILDGR